MLVPPINWMVSAMIRLYGHRSIACGYDGTQEALSPSLRCCSFDRCSFQKAEKSFPVKSSWCRLFSLRHPCNIRCSGGQVELVFESSVIAASVSITNLPVRAFYTQSGIHKGQIYYGRFFSFKICIKGFLRSIIKIFLLEF